MRNSLPVINLKKRNQCHPPPAPPVPLDAKPEGKGKKSKPRSASSGVAVCFRVIAYLILAGGFLTMFAAMEVGAVAILSGLGAVIGSLPFFAISVMIEALLQIQENTRRIAEKIG